MSKFRKWNLREPKLAKFPGGACPRTPLEARAFGANNYSLFSITWDWNLCFSEAIFIFPSQYFPPYANLRNLSADQENWQNVTMQPCKLGS